MARTHASCISCGVNLPVAEMISANPLDRGGKPGYICNRCNDRINSYYCGTSEKGKAKSEKWTVSVELETANHTPAGHGNLLHNGFRASSDSSLGYNGIEYKSPVYQGFGGIVKYSKSIQKMLDSGDLEIDRHCGHHAHIGRTDIENHLGGNYDINAKTLDMLWEYRHELLIPLGNYLAENPDVSRKVFGRSLTGYADHPLSAWSNSRREHTNRYCFVNFCTEGKNPNRPDDSRKYPEYAKTIEFRLNFFKNAEQYGKLLMLEKNMVNCIIYNFLDYAVLFNENTLLRKQAQKTGLKLIRLVEKAARE